MNDYAQFVATKLSTVPPTGIADGFSLPGSLFPHQSALTAWALRRGRAAIFADTGLGKSRMQLSWAAAVHRHTKRPVLILAPLAVAAQTVSEGAELGVEVQHCRDGAEVGTGINITNYDRLHRFDPAMFGAVVLDESSCIKHHNSKTLSTLLSAFKETPFKLCATATPAPNDWVELGTHAEFLGICTRQEMLAEYFTHDGGDTSSWRLKGHARAIFWRWVASWGAMIRKPSDLGFDDGAYNLPALHLHEHSVEFEMPLNGMLFAAEAQSLSERRQSRRESMADRVAACASTICGGWYKLATPTQQDGANGLEKGIFGDAESEVGSGPGIQSQEECAVSEGQGGARGVHESVLRGEPRQVQEAHAGAAGEVQRSSAQEVRGVIGVQGCNEGGGKGVAAGEPDKAQSAEAEAVRDRFVGLQRLDDDSGRGLCDLWALGHKHTEHVSACGPLPHDGQDSRPALQAMQSGTGFLSGRQGQAICGNRIPVEAWLIWCDLNDEQDALELAFGNQAFSVRGSDTEEKKELAIRGWLAGDRPVMISKPSIMGFGLNFQHCARMAFVGVTDSYEAYYQAVRRCWRFGQKREVHVHIFASKAEGSIVSNLKRKEREAGEMAESLGSETREAVRSEVVGLTRETNSYNAVHRVKVPAFLREAA